MKRRVIIDLPKGQSGLEVKMKNLRAGLGFNANTMPWPVMAGKMSEPKLQVNSTLRPVPREEANLEAEKDEVAALPTKSGIPDTFKIGGKRHHSGGTPLNLPSDSFIFSDTAKMRIKDPAVLAQFGMPERKNGYTPADIAKKYDINSFKKILVDPDTDKLQKQTAELMISNYNLKLAKLAIIQESMKGFPQGIPAIAMPYIEEMEIDPAQFVQMNPGGAQDEQAQTQQGEMDDVGAEARFGGYMEDGGYIDYFEGGGPVAPYNNQPVSPFIRPIAPQQIDPEIAELLAKKARLAESLKAGQEAIYRSTASREEEALRKSRDIVMKRAADKAREQADFTKASLNSHIRGLQKKLEAMYMVEKNLKDLIAEGDMDLEDTRINKIAADLQKAKQERERLKKEMTDTMVKIHKLDPPSTSYYHEDDKRLYPFKPSTPIAINYNVPLYSQTPLADGSGTIDYGKPAWVDKANQSLDPNAKKVVAQKPAAENNDLSEWDKYLEK